MEMNNLTQLEYENLEWADNNFNANSMEKLKSLLMIKKDGDKIYICHPRHLLNSMEEDSKTKEIKYVDFDDIDVEKMIRYNDFGCYSMVEQLCSKKNNQYTYILKKASHMIKKYQQEGVSQFSYPFVILEEINKQCEEPQYSVRGIVSCNQKGFSIAFNPKAIKTMTKESVWQKGLRLGDNYD